MPLYDYDCAACGSRFEVIHGVHGDGPTQCPRCGGGPVRKAFAAPAIHFKGSGWAKKERRATVSSAAKTATGDDASPPAGGDAATNGPSEGGASATPSSASKGSGAAGPTVGTTAD